MNKRIIIGLIGVLLLFISYAVIPQIVFANPDNITIYVNADSWVSEANKDGNYGAITIIEVRTWIDYNGRVFLKFSLNDIPDGAIITLATLKFLCSGISGLVAGVTDVQARRVANDSWLENEITWNNQPSYGDVEDTKVPIAWDWTEWNIIGFVQDEFDGDKTVSICIRCVVENYDGTYRYIRYLSKEYESGSIKSELYIEYSTVSDNEPFYSNAGYDGKTQVGLNADFWCYWEDDFALDECYFSTNNTGTWANSSISVSGTFSWANITKQLNFTASIRIEYKWFCMDNASQWNQTSTYFLDTTPLYIIFNHNNYTMGKFKVDNVFTENETQNSYNYNQNIMLDGITWNSDYLWKNFVWTGGSATTNNYNYSTSGNNTIWCNFDLAGNGIIGIDENYFVLGFVISGCAILFVVIVIKNKNKGDR